MATDLLSADTATAACPTARPADSVSPKGCVSVDASPTEPGSETEIVSTNGAGRGSSAVNTEKTVAGEGRSAFSLLLSDYLQLTKPRIVVMILVTTCATAMMGATGLVAVGSLAWLLFGTAAIAGSAGTGNQIWERVIDARMTRTANRPISSGRMSAEETEPSVRSSSVTFILHFPMYCTAHATQPHQCRNSEIHLDRKAFRTQSIANACGRYAADSQSCCEAPKRRLARNSKRCRN